MNIRNKMLTGINIRARFLVRKLNLSSELVAFFELPCFIIGILNPDALLGLLDIAPLLFLPKSFPNTLNNASDLLFLI